MYSLIIFILVFVHISLWYKMFLVHIRISCYISSEYVGFGDNFSDLNFRFTERPYVRKFETIFSKYVTQFDREQSPVNIRKYKCLV